MGAEPATAAFLDAVCCVQFCAAGKGGLLLSILRRFRWEIHIPGEVDREVRGKASKYDLRTEWVRFVAKDDVHVLPVLTIDPVDELSQQVGQVVVSLRGAELALALGRSKDLGETVVVAYGKVFTAQGRKVLVLMDDQGGSDLATDHDLTVVTIEDLLLLGHRSEIPGLVTKADVRKVYEQLRPFGGSLVSWDRCELKRKL